jgi:hypothetical protein
VKRRWLRISFAFFWFIWTGIVVPGHTRGAIPLNPSGASCCRHDVPTDPKAPPAKSSSNCAICYFAAHLMPAIAVPVNLEPGALIETAVIPQFQAPMLPAPDAGFLSRGPPVLLDTFIG